MHMHLINLAIFNIGGGEIILILVLLFVLAALACGVFGLVYLLVRAVNNRPPPVITSLSPEAIQNLRKRDLEHVKLLAIFHFILSGFAVLGMGFLGLHYFMMHTFFTNPEMWRNQRNGPPPQAFLDMFVWFYVIGGLILLAALVLNLLSGIFLSQRKNKSFSIIIAGLDCLQIPFGTALGIFTIIVLTRDSVRQLYSNR